MYMCVRGNRFCLCVYDLSVGVLNCSDSVVLNCSDSVVLNCSDSVVLNCSDSVVLNCSDSVVLFWFSFSYWTLIDNKSLDFWKPLLIGRSIHDFFVFLLLCLFLIWLIVTKYPHLRFQGIFSLSLRYFLFFTTIWYLYISYLYHRQFFYRNDYISNINNI